MSLWNIRFSRDEQKSDILQLKSWSNSPSLFSNFRLFDEDDSIRRRRFLPKNAIENLWNRKSKLEFEYSRIFWWDFYIDETEKARNVFKNQENPFPC